MQRKKPDDRAAHADSATREDRIDKRGEPRIQATGDVQILVHDFNAESEIAGTLVDISASGFRASHRHGALMNGLLVRFRHEYAAGVARVIWNRITGDSVETGFFILSKQGH